MAKIYFINIILLLKILLLTTACGPDVESMVLSTKNQNSDDRLGPRRSNQNHDDEDDKSGQKIFSHIDWSNPTTFGPDCSGGCVKPTKSPIEDHVEMAAFGIIKENYVSVFIKGDGSCWIRSAVQALLFPVFQDPKIFARFLELLDVHFTNLSKVPGFKERFILEDLKTLLTTLNRLSPRERLAQFNKEKVDLFLDNSFRTLLHAHRYDRSLRIVDDEARSKEIDDLKKLLVPHSWGDIYSANNDLAYLFLPDQPFLRLSNINFSKPYSLWLNIDRCPVDKSKESFAFSNLDGEKMANFLEKKPRKKDPKNKDIYEACIKTFSLSKIADWHLHPAMSVFSYRQYDGHVALMVHKQQAEAFGFTP